MKKVVILLISMLIGFITYAQNGANDNLSKNTIEAFHHGNYTRKVAQKDMYVYRFVNNDDKYATKTGRDLWATPDKNIIKNFFRSMAMSLPGTSRADAYVIVKIPAGTVYYEGFTSSGTFLTYKKGNETISRLISHDDYRNDKKGFDAAVANYKKEMLDKGYKLQNDVKGTGGVAQIFISQAEVNRKDEFKKEAVSIVSPKPIELTTVSFGRQNPYPNAANDNNPPSRPANGSPALKPSPSNDNYVPPTNVRMKSSQDVEHVKEVIKKYETVPGGIIVTPKPVLDFSIKSVKYLGNGVFLVNNAYKYETNLSEEELGTIFQTAYLSKNTRFGALNQDKMTGMPQNGAVAFTLSQADHYVGKMTYGYDGEGYGLSAFEKEKGYVNPLDAEVEDIASGNKEKLGRIFMRKWHELQPRFFLEYEKVEFKLDEKSMQLVARNTDVTINAQVFYTHNNKTFSFLDVPPTHYFPHFVNAIMHIEKNYAAYEQKQPQLTITRNYAEVYAFFTAARQAKVKVDNSSVLITALKEREPITIVLNDYNAIGEKSNLAEYWKKSLPLIEKNFVANSDSAVIGMTYLLELALNAKDFDRIVKYRRLVEQKLNLWHNAKKLTDAQYFKHLNDARMDLPMDVNSQINFGYKYFNDDKNVALLNFGKAFDFFSALIKADTNMDCRHYLTTINMIKTIQPLSKNDPMIDYYKILEERANQGDVFAELSFAYILEEGSEYVKKDVKRANKYYLKAANKGYGSAKSVIAFTYLEKTEKDPAKIKTSVIWIEQAAKDGYIIADYHLGYVHEMGFKDGKPDLVKAKEYYKKASDNGIPQATIRLKQLALNAKKINQ